MKFLIISSVLLLLLLHTGHGQKPSNKRMVCYYNSAGAIRPGFAKFTIEDLKYSLQFCTHLMYGFAGLTPATFFPASLNPDLDMYHYREVTALKTQFPNLKIYLSLGGDADLNNTEKYLNFLEGGQPMYNNFIQGSVSLLKMNGFDGLDLAFQFARNKPRKVHSSAGLFWKKIKKVFTGDFIVDLKADEHKQQFSEFVGSLKQSFSMAQLQLSLTVLPNVNSTWYFDIPKIKDNFEFINLFAFDFLTPERNPEEADYTAPIFLKDEQNRLPHYNIDFQVNHWLQNGCPLEKLNLGIATYGRSWKLSEDSGLSGMPVVPETAGPAEAGLQSQQAGLLSWPEICSKLASTPAADYRGPKAPLRKVSDLDMKYGVYAFRPADENNEHGLWISFDDPDFASYKASYARQKGLGGMAIYDVTFDDFRGLCTGNKFPILRSINSHL